MSNFLKKIKSNYSYAAFFFLFMVFHVASSATDIDCKRAEMQRYEEIICEYPIINSQYEKIYRQQEDLISGGHIQQNTVESWKNKRDLCMDVRCMDSIFAEWKLIVASEAKKIADQEYDAQENNSSGEQKSRLSTISADGVAKPNPDMRVENSDPSLDASMAQSTEKIEKEIPENSTAETQSPKQSGGGGGAIGGIGGIVFIVLISLAVFKGKGATKSKKTITESVKPKRETYIRGWQCCARCEYWSGGRDVEFRNTVTVDKGNMKGKCLVEHGYPRPSDANSRCVKWRRWGALTE